MKYKYIFFDWGYSYEQNLNNKWKRKEDMLIEPDYRIKLMKELLEIV